MIKTCISKGWKFTEIPSKGEFLDVDLPHDYSILKQRDKSGDPSMGFFQLGCAKYVKYLNLSPNKHYILWVDGAYSLSEVNLNENLIAQHPHGYTPYLVDLTEYVLGGVSNKLVITTNPLEHSTRWYSGAGLYRDVFLCEGGDVRIEPWDLFVSSRNVTEDKADVVLKYTLTSDADKTGTVAFRVANAEGKTIAEATVPFTAKAGGKTENECVITVANPVLWDVDNPYLYTVYGDVCSGGEVLDESESTFGIKTFSVSPEDGLILNGKPVKLRGGCIHHDHGALGATAYPVAEERKIRLLKEAGFNAVRIAHNPPSLAMLEACDRLGMILMDEAFDIWAKRKFVTHDYHIFFKEWWQRDIASMVKRDRNHPCVLSYSIGNEIYEIDGTSNGAMWAKTLTEEVKKHDDTKLVTACIQKISLAEYQAESIDPEDYKVYMRERTGNGDVERIMDITREIEAPLDIIGFNYYHKKYDIFHKKNPDKVIWGSENWNIGENANIYDYWQNVLNNSYNIGDFTWTAIDNLGEVGHGAHWWDSDLDEEGGYYIVYPWRTCNQGDLDLCGRRRPQSYFRESVWFGNNPIRIFTTHPKHHGEKHYGTRWHWNDVDETWTFDDSFVGKPVKCETYTGADYVLWYLNGKEIGKTVPEKNIATLETTYEKGELKAVAYKDGQKTSEATLVTADESRVIRLKAETDAIRADGRDLCYIDAILTDSKGVEIVEWDKLLTCRVEGGKLEAFFCANPCGDDDFTSKTAHPYKGRVLAVVSATEKGKLKLTVSGADLPDSTIEINVV